MEIRNISKAGELIDELEKLYRQDGWIFRGQSNSDFFLIPSAFRESVIKRRLEEFPATPLYQEWCLSKELKEKIFPPFAQDYIHTLHVQRISELTFYLMHYNYFLAQHVQKNKEKFDSATIKMYELRPILFWAEKETFLYLFEFGFTSSVGRVALDGKVISNTTINEELASYDESLSQHYDTETGALDFTNNPWVALYFALKKIPKDASHFSVFAYKQLQDSKENPIIIKSGHEECKNLRIERQEGLLICLRFACLYYFIHGKWPSLETFIPHSKGFFELIEFRVPISEAQVLKLILEQKGITEEYLFPDLEEVLA
jgi:hypothetical protein